LKKEGNKMGFKVLIPEDITAAGKDCLKSLGYTVEVMSNPTEDKICEAVKDCDAILARNFPYTRKIMEAGKKLKVIARYGVGTDKIDLQAATELGIQVTNAPTANTNAVAEHVIALLLACADHILYQDAQTRAGNFKSRDITKSLEIKGRVLGLIGCGRIGQSVAEKASKGFGMKVIGYDAFIPEDRWPKIIERRENMEDLIREADVISLHVPRTKDTMNMINKDNMKLMKKTAILLNCARGGVVNEADLYEALKNKAIFAAGIDVFATEPASKDNPLFTLDNITVSPHNAALSVEAMDQMGMDAAHGIDDVLHGRKPKYPVNKLDK
jgi:D-3-phosphoglycerate dehydrogenase